jgi:hypothetical protein
MKTRLEEKYEEISNNLKAMERYIDSSEDEE